MLRIPRSVNSDLIAAEARYHKACHASYVSKSNLQYQGFYRKEKTKHNEASNELLEIITPEIMAGKAYMNILLGMYKEFLQKKSVDCEGYTRQKLKSRSTSHFQEKLVFHQPSVCTKAELVYSSSVSLLDVINAASS